MYEELVNKFGYIEGQGGFDEDGDPVIVTIDEESATVRTFQKNGYERIMVYWKDGTIEELYEH